MTITELKEVHAKFHPRGALIEADVRKAKAKPKPAAATTVTAEK